jgi:hypothetical protein
MPAKGRLLRGDIDITLIRTNSRQLGSHEWSRREWAAAFQSAGLSLRDELGQLVKTEIGESYSIEDHSFSGYLGVTSDHWYSLVVPK